ncbi:MAG TPA: hypothetical protein VIH90_01160 [Candidatus Saccharimonadales bacterium]
MELALTQQIPQVAKTAPIRWCLYASKSSEQDERQEPSLSSNKSRKWSYLPTIGA